MIRFYTPDIATTLTLSEVESGHCCRVLRMRQGDDIQVVDGNGRVYECRIVDANPRRTSVEILNVIEENQHWSPHITLAVAPTKNIDRMEWLAEKAVEIGVDKFVFINCKHNVRRVVKRERIEKIMISAMKQSLKCRLPKLVEITEFNSFIEDNSFSSRYFGYCDADTPRLDFVDAYDGREDIVVMIGPEGDFSHDEVSRAIELGWKPVTFGNTRLRTETAALYSLVATHVIIDLKN